MGFTEMALLKNFTSKENIKMGGIRPRSPFNMKVITYLYADRNNPTKYKKLEKNGSTTTTVCKIRGVQMVVNS